MKKLVLALALSLAFTNAHAMDCSAPEKFVSSLSSQVIETIEAKGNDAAKEKQLSNLFKSVVNTEWMAKFVLGRNWNNITPAQQSKYLSTYGNYLVASYVPTFRKYNGEKIEVKSSKPTEREGEFSVSTVIERSSGNIPVNYRVKKVGSCYKVNDIAAEGISLLNTQRQDFNAVFSARGYDGLIAALEAKIAAPAAGTTAAPSANVLAK